MISVQLSFPTCSTKIHKSSKLLFLSTLVSIDISLSLIVLKYPIQHLVLCVYT